MRRLVIDTSVIVEYINARGLYRLKAARMFEKAATGSLKLYVSVVTLSEVLYVASRIYEVAGLERPNERALDLVDWIRGRAQVVEVNEDIALRAGEIKKKLGIALSDCYVIATAQTLDATPVFRKIEKEMESKIESLRALGVEFLDEIGL